MIASPSLISLPLFLASCVLGDSLLGFKVAPEIETRTLDEIHKAALAEGGVVTLWHGGDEANQQDALKQAFEQRFPGMTLNVTVDLSKYHDARLDQQIATGKVSVDSIILQTVHDYPRWADEGVLLNYAPVGFDAINDAVKDSSSAAYYGLFYFLWQTIYNTDKLGNISIVEFDDFLKPELKNKLVFTYPNDDDAVLFAFELM
jgi:ABC-type glycerol-3-phosphate transport system substrate-binding protein